MEDYEVEELVHFDKEYEFEYKSDPEEYTPRCVQCGTPGKYENGYCGECSKLIPW